MREKVKRGSISSTFRNGSKFCVAMCHDINGVSFTNKINFNQKFLLCYNIII